MPKILWLSPYSLHDTSSGASIHAKIQLEHLVKRGWQVWSLSSFVFDNPSGTTVFGDLEKKLAEDQHKTFILDDNGIHYIYTRCQYRNEMAFSLNEGNLLYETFLDVLDEYKPDIIYGYCPGMPSMACFAEAKRRGIATVYLLLNGNHGHFSFPNYDLVVTDSIATAKYYAERDKINVIPTGAAFNKDVVVAPDRAPKYITFINPVGAKGLPIFAKIAKMAQKELPNERFLVINSRGNFAQTVTTLHEPGDLNKKPFTAKDFPNVDVAGTQKDMRAVYRMTKVLLAPSLWYESWGRVTTEAVLNNIPVLSSTSGGIIEASGGGGIAIEAPQHCTIDQLELPTDEEIRPWMDALKRLLTEDWSVQLQKAQEQLSIERTIDRTIAAFMPLYRKAVIETNRPLYYYQ